MELKPLVLVYRKSVLQPLTEYRNRYLLKDHVLTEHN